MPGAIDVQERPGRRPRPANSNRSHWAREDIAFLQYTGGTTGVAKAAMLTHRNMVANVLQALRLDQSVAAERDGAYRHHRAAAVSHLCADQQLPGFPAARRAATC